jgi:hypothetical protein
VQDWNFTVEKEVMVNTLLRASYLATTRTSWSIIPSTMRLRRTSIRDDRPGPAHRRISEWRSAYDQTVYGTLAEMRMWAGRTSMAFLEAERRSAAGMDSFL